MFWFLKCHALLVLFMLSRYGNCKVFKRVRNKVVRFFSMVKYMYNNCYRSAKYKWNSTCDYRGTSYKKEMQGWIGNRTHIFGANGKFISISAEKKYRKKTKQQSSRKYSWKRDNLRGENLSWKNVPPSGTDALKEIIYDEGVNNETVTVCSYRFRWKLTVSHNW